MRCLVLGCSGSGKSTTARALGAACGVPVTHMDQLYFEPGWHPVPDELFRDRLGSVVAQPAWIIDGNYVNWLEPRLARATHVIFLDLPRWLCLWGVIERWLRFRGRCRPDSAAGCPEKIDCEFLRFVWGYARRTRPRVLVALEEARRRGLQVEHVRTREHARALVRTASSG